MSIAARAAVCRASDLPFTIEEVTLDDPRADEVLVRIAAVGICHTDLAVRDGQLPVPKPVVLGHEGAGIVERVGTDVIPTGCEFDSRGGFPSGEKSESMTPGFGGCGHGFSNSLAG